MLRTFLLDCNFVWETNRSKKVLKNYTAITKTWPILCKLDHSKRNVIISKNFYMGQCICKPNSTLQWRHQNRILLLLNGNLANANMPTCLGVATRGHRELERWYISFSIVCPKLSTVFQKFWLHEVVLIEDKWNGMQIFFIYPSLLMIESYLLP